MAPCVLTLCNNEGPSLFGVLVQAQQATRHFADWPPISNHNKVSGHSTRVTGHPTEPHSKKTVAIAMNRPAQCLFSLSRLIDGTTVEKLERCRGRRKIRVSQ